MKISIKTLIVLFFVFLFTETTRAQNWLTSGNTVTSGQWLGSNNAADLIFKTGTGGIERLRMTSTGLIGINNSSPLYFIDAKCPSVSSTSESLLNLTVSDATNDYLRVWNGTGGNNTFYPVLAGFKSSTLVACPALAVIGTVTSSIDSPLDPNAVVMFSARKDAGGVAGAVINRPLFSWTNLSTQYMTMLANGNLGINYPSPTEKLQVDNGVFKLSSPNSYGGPMMLFAASPTASYVGDWGIEYRPSAEGNPGLNFWKPFGGPNGGNNYLFLSDNTHIGINTNNPTARLTVNGNVLIGDPGTVTLPAGYNLYVQGGILTDKVKVAVVNSTSWADFVFDEKYNLKSINELEVFIKKNKHLPNIPSADQVVEEGIDMATMDAKLLEKIEELSLYIIEQNKRIAVLEQEILKRK